MFGEKKGENSLFPAGEGVVGMPFSQAPTLALIHAVLFQAKHSTPPFLHCGISLPPPAPHSAFSLPIYPLFPSLKERQLWLALYAVSTV